jgi:cofilin
MQSGIVIEDNVREEFQAMRMKRKHRYIIYKVSADKSTVEIESMGERSATWEDFKAAVPVNHSR